MRFHNLKMIDGRNSCSLFNSSDLPELSGFPVNLRSTKELG